MQKAFLPKGLLAVFAGVMLILLAGGIWFYQTRSQAIHRDAEEGLTIIAKMKVNQIAKWRTERLADAVVARGRPFFQTSIEQLTVKRNTETINELCKQFKIIAGSYYYSDVFLVDTSGVIIVSLSGHSGRIDEHALESLNEAFVERKAVLTELHAGDEEAPPHISAIAPFFARKGGDSVPIGGIFLQSDAEQFLYPLIQSWPTTSKTAETYIARALSCRKSTVSPVRYRSSPDVLQGNLACSRIPQGSWKADSYSPTSFVKGQRPRRPSG